MSEDAEAELPEAWRGTLSAVLAPLRYPIYALQLVTCYVGQMAPGGRIAVAALFQSADEIRRVQRLTTRVQQIRRAHPGFGRGSRATWQCAPLWQPMRQVLEGLLAAYDWRESFVALNLVVKPMFDELFMNHFARVARARGDEVLAETLRALDQDCHWHRTWSASLLSAIDPEPSTSEAARTWTARWFPRALAAVSAFEPVLESPGTARAVELFCRDYLLAAGIDVDVP